MGKHIHRFILHSIVYISLLLSSNLYAGEAPTISKVTKADYLELCSIYEEITSKPVDARTKEIELVETIQRKLPDLLNEIYEFSMGAAPKDRYKLIKEHAKYRNKFTWKCEAARLYYINDFKKDK